MLRIGDRCVIGRGSHIVAHHSIEIGDDVYTGPYVYITDQNHGYADPDLPIGRQWPVNAAVRIGAGTWLGTGVVILPGSVIGRNVVVAAGSVVRGEIAGPVRGGRRAGPRRPGVRLRRWVDPRARVVPLRVPPEPDAAGPAEPDAARLTCLLRSGQRPGPRRAWCPPTRLAAVRTPRPAAPG